MVQLFCVVDIAVAPVLRRVGGLGGVQHAASSKKAHRDTIECERCFASGDGDGGRLTRG